MGLGRRITRRGTPLLAGAVAVALLAGCSGSGDRDTGEAGEPDGVVRLVDAPEADAAAEVLAGRGDLSVPASRALFEAAPLAVVVDDGGDVARAGEQAEEHGVPLLVIAVPDAPGTGPRGASPRQLTAELERLGAEQVLAVGEAARAWAQEALDVDVVGPRDDVEAPEQDGTREGLVALTTGRSVEAAAAATARAAGASVVRVPGGDPRASARVVERLSAEPPTSVLGLSGRFGDAETLAQRMRVVATGVQLPGGGQVPFPGRHMVALYGYPGAPSLGVLGEQDLDATIERAKRVAAEYDGVVDDPVVPTLEIITTVASGSPGPDGDFSNESDPADLRPWIEAAADNDVYVVLDLQPGRTDFLTQAKRYADLLREPHVGLALDPEWRLGPGERHLRQIGSVGVDEVNRVGDWLARLTREADLPPKVFLLHQFQQRMVEGRERLDMSHDELVPLVHADGHGTPGQKRATYDSLQTDAPAGLRWGWKNFYDEDRPTMTPGETMAVTPTPDFVSYQ